MNKTSVFKILSLGLGVLLCCTEARAADLKNPTSITFDFQNRQIQFYGIYAPAKSSARAVGLDAEIVARRNGIAHLSQYLTQSCGGSETDAQKIATPSWQAAVKSQGSEIFSNGVLKIALVAPVKDVLKETSGKKAQTLKAKDGTPLALKLPKVPASMLKCGFVNITLGDRTIALNPLSGSSDSAAKAVSFSLQGGTLKPATSADVALLENSNLMNTEGSTSGGNTPVQKTAPETGASSSATEGGATSGQKSQ